MDYFELTADPAVSNPIQIQHIDHSLYKNNATREEFDAVPQIVVGYFDHSPQVELYDLLDRPAFLISDRLKRLFTLYDPDMQFKGIRVYANDPDDMQAPLYWMPYVPPIACLSEETVRYPSGATEHLILDRSALNGENIFRVDGILEHKVVITLAVAESMIRRKMTGFTLTPIHFAKISREESKPLP